MRACVRSAAIDAMVGSFGVPSPRALIVSLNDLFINPKDRPNGGFGMFTQIYDQFDLCRDRA
jgi:hypothetical protein